MKNIVVSMPSGVQSQYSVQSFLDQKGASGSIPSASLLRKEDVGEKYENIPVIGYFVRPFTAEFSVKLNL